MRIINPCKLAAYSILIMVCFLSSCKNHKAPIPSNQFIDVAGMDSLVKPGDDFFEYANGNWYRHTQIPADQSGWGVAHILFDDNRKKLHAMLEALAAGKEFVEGSSEQMMGDLYAAAMDSVTIDQRGYMPVAPDLKRIDTISSVAAFIRECAHEYTSGNDNIFGVFVAPDDRNVNMNRLQFFQDGLSLPDRDYYLNNGNESRAIRSAFLEYVVNVLRTIGTDSASAARDAVEILQLETSLAKSHATPVELRDPVKNYHKYSLRELRSLTPEINWDEFLQVLGLKTDTVLVAQPAYFTELNKQLSSTPLSVWKNKLKLKIIEDAPLGAPFEDLKFSFYSKKLKGIQEKPARWKRATNTVNELAGDLLGKLYVQEYFPQTAKDRMLTLVNNLQQVYEKRIKELDWMSNNTKQKALIKLNSFVKKIGYPDKWKDYAGVTISRNDHFTNVRQLKIYAFKRDMAKVDKTVDKTEWFMNASEVNAYYNPAFNEIVFPAGILQPPFFNNAADDAVNYGAIGAIIGHEMTHGFDDQGRQYDADGNLRDWWTEEDAEQFRRKAKVVVDQYNAYIVLDSLHVNGALTLGENIADIGGLMIAYEAFKNTEQGKGNEKIDGISSDQRFFLSFANTWRSKHREAALKEMLLLDPHSPEKFRTNGPVSSMPEFYRAFNVLPGDSMYRPDSIRAKIW